MSVQDTSLNPKIFNSAVNEFLDKGFLNASLKDICNRAGVTTGALYKRYKNKADLFDAVVEGTLNSIEQYSGVKLDYNAELLESEALSQAWEMSEETHILITNYFYDHYEGLRLLLVCSEGTKHSSFMHDFIDKNTKTVHQFITEVHRRGMTETVIDYDILHTLLSAYWMVLFEPVIHGYPREKAIESARVIDKFFAWERVLGF